MARERERQRFMSPKSVEDEVADCNASERELSSYDPLWYSFYDQKPIEKPRGWENLKEEQMGRGKDAVGPVVIGRTEELDSIAAVEEERQEKEKEAEKEASRAQKQAEIAFRITFRDEAKRKQAGVNSKDDRHFIRSANFTGPRTGYVFQTAGRGTGYYSEEPVASELELELELEEEVQEPITDVPPPLFARGGSGSGSGASASIGKALMGMLGQAARDVEEERTVIDVAVKSAVTNTNSETTTATKASKATAVCETAISTFTDMEELD